MAIPISTGYSRAQIALHWAVAALVVAQYLAHDAIVAAWSAHVQGKAYGFDPLIPAHVVGGALILVLVLWRIALRVARGAPPPPDQEPPILGLLARGAHLAFYAVLIALSVSGGLAWFADLRPAVSVHNVLKGMLLALIAVHVLAVIFHRIVLKSGVMQRMVRPGA
ncbi:cytochrome b [Chelatococcus asaccharovorans]|uniref:cytochrome b n=1 Tax=Chelatococcus asaccharovorans TaxID=28210 RepID=UPI00224C69B2|nr:cytochrome b/b6 domain-containing protein [Chelatococcus asaccharovorans]CAH1673952.1 Cytochrome B [Chelatococcus asaccharovorans]CAH1674658.1 Cytochrome B [Chelatococcus asaccharovorans]